MSFKYLTKSEFGDKIKDLKTELQIDSTNCIDITNNIII